jgi:hypothetical protein
LSKIQTISRTLYEHSLRAFPSSREAYRTGLARRRRDAEEVRRVNLGSACALRGSGVTGCGFLQTRAICENRGICAANDASSQPAARKLAYPCPPESRSAQEDVNFVHSV